MKYATRENAYAQLAWMPGQDINVAIFSNNRNVGFYTKCASNVVERLTITGYDKNQIRLFRKEYINEAMCCQLSWRM